ncbi:MAG: helix-turn-helix domain-containing protein [Bacteroidales bacterium]
MPANTLTHILGLWTIGLSCLMCAIVLILSRDRNRMRLLLGVVLGVSGIWYIVHTLQFFSHGFECLNPFTSYSFISRSITFSLFALCVPLEILKPSYWNWRKIVTVTTPLFLWTSGYYLLKKTGIISPVDCHQFSDIIEFRTHPDVWAGRIIPYLMAFALQLYAMKEYFRLLPVYKSYVEMNYADSDYYNKRWLNVSAFANLIMLLSYSFAVVIESMPLFIIHSILFFIIIVYQTIQALNLKIVAGEFEEINNMPRSECSPSFESGTHQPLEDPLGEQEELDRLKIAIETWLLTDRPYMKTTFQQLDVMEKFAITRYMATKVFRDGFKSSFAEYVHNARIKESCLLMKKYPTLPISEVATMVGYSSPSVFTRAFTKHKKKSPTVWRDRR